MLNVTAARGLPRLNGESGSCVTRLSTLSLPASHLEAAAIAPVVVKSRRVSVKWRAVIIAVSRAGKCVTQPASAVCRLVPPSYLPASEGT